MRRVRVLAAGFAALLVVATYAAPAEGQRNAVQAAIRGQVIDDDTGEGIGGVKVEVLDDRERIRRSVVADDSGYFALRQVTPGWFWLRATRIGYARTKTPPWEVASGEVLTVEIRMDRSAVVLAPLEVTARAITVSPVLSGFHERARRRMGGFYVGRQDIERQQPTRVTDLLATVPGVTVQNAGGMAAGRTVLMARALPGAGRTAASPCPVQIYIDGVLATRGRQVVSPDDLVVPESLEGVEVYRGISTVPPEFLTPEARCGVIAFWTRRGG